MYRLHMYMSVKCMIRYIINFIDLTKFSKLSSSITALGRNSPRSLQAINFAM